MLQYNRKQYNPHSATTEANLKRHWFYAVIFEKNPNYHESSQRSETDEEGNTETYYDVDGYKFDVTLFENAPDERYFWRFNEDQFSDALVIKHQLASTDVEAYVWLDHPIHKRIFCEYTCPDDETVVVKFLKGKLPPKITVTVQLRTYVTDNVVRVTESTTVNQAQSQSDSYTEEKPTVALMFRAGTLEGLYQILESIDSEYWKSDSDDYVAHTIRDIRSNQDIKVMIYYKNDLNEVLDDIGDYYKIIKTWLTDEDI